MEGMKDYSSKFQIILELFALSERAFLYKLKQKKPNLSPAEIEEQRREWCLTRPGAEYGDGEGILGDSRRFQK